MLTAEVNILFIPEKFGKTIIVTVGNSLRGDDGLGPFVSSKLKDQNLKFVVIDAGERPENIIEEAVALKPAKVIIIDAANFQGHPGETRIIPSDSINDVVISTHKFPLRAVQNIIEMDSNAKVYFLGVQVKTVELGAVMTNDVKAAAEEIIKCVMQYREK